MTMSASRPPRPVPGPSRDYRFPHFERRSLPTGLSVVVAPIPRLPIATVLAVVDAGAVTDPRGREGAALLTARLLLEGAGDRDGPELSEAFEQRGATIESSADWDCAVVSMTVTTAHLRGAFELFADVVRRPSFRVREVERLKSERLAELIQQRAEPRGLADEAFNAVLYERSSRYSVSDGGTETSIAAIGVEDITGLYAARYSPTTTTLIVAGDITVDQALELVSASFGDFHGSAARTVVAEQPPARGTRATHLVPKADAPQSELRIGHVGVPRMHEDYFDIVVMNAIFGGLFNSRINLNLREAHAYTYGAFSAFDWRRAAGPFVISTAVQSDVTVQAIQEVCNEVDRMRREPVPADELSLATSYLDGVFPIRYETTAAVATALANQVIYGLPDDYFDRYRERIRAVTVDSVKRAAEKYLNPSAMQVVVVGDPAVLSQPLAALGFGQVVTVESAR